VAEVLIAGVDGSDAGARAAQLAAKHAREAAARLVVAYVVPWSPFTVQTAEENERRHLAKEEEVAAARREIVDVLVDRLRAEGTEVEGVVRHGHPAETLCDIASEQGAVHIVVGRRGQSRVRALLFGSTAGNLIQITTVPVTVVP
jgi:nucleotide-binding universal stress UspA family protein